MNKLDDIEITNASAWDEGTQGRHPSQTIAEVVSRPKQHSNRIRLAPLRQVQGGITEVPRTIPRRPVMNSRTEQKVGKSDLVIREQHRQKRSGRAVKTQIGKKVEWTKQNAVNTKRKQDYLDREAKKAAKSAEFLSLPSDDAFPAEGYYFWSDDNIDPNSLLGEDLQQLDDIRMSYEVYIDFVEALSCIRLQSKRRCNIESGITGIKAKIQHARADAASCAPIYIVEPPAVDAMRFEVSPILLDSQQVEKQPIVIGLVLSGSWLTAEQRAAWEVERQAIIKYIQNRFSAHMTKALTELRVLNRTMRMRVNIGKIHLIRYRKELKEGGYSFRKFSSMMEEFCTTGKFERMYILPVVTHMKSVLLTQGSIHGASVAGKILDMFSTATSIFAPTDSLTSHLADVEAKHSLVVIAHESSGQSVRIKADIDIIQSVAQKDTGWQIGTIKYFHYGHNAHKTRLAVGNLSVESNFDSCLEITTEEVMPQPLKIFQKLVENSISGTSTFVTEKSSLVYPSVRLLVPQGTVVERVRAFQYKLQNTSYIAEVAMYNGWNNADTRQEPLTNCGVSLYHKDWDLLMTLDEGIEGPTGLDIRSLFPDEFGPGDGIPSFLAHVQTLQRFVGLA